MPNKDLLTKMPSQTDIIEEQSQLILRSKLPLNEASIGYQRDKYPTWDGIMEFFNVNGSTATKLFFQLKGTQKDISFYDAETTFLHYCYKAYEPHFLILVNIPGNKVYWEHIDKAYIENVLGIKDFIKFNQRTKRIRFLKANIIEQNSSGLIEVCKKHYIDNAKNFIPITKTSVILIPSEEELMPFNEVKKKFATTTEGLEEKIMLYHSFVYALKPFYLDQRGEEKRRKLINLLQITDSQERFIVESLVNSNLLGRIGDLIFVTKKEEAVSTLNHYIDTGQLDLEKITQLFSQNEDKD